MPVIHNPEGWTLVENSRWSDLCDGMLLLKEVYAALGEDVELACFENQVYMRVTSPETGSNELE